jgi:serine/threonine protein phosphatase PrpC
LRVIAYGKTDKGRVRKENEDAFCIEEDLGLLAIADGMGGHASGEMASEMAIEILRESIKREGEPLPHRLSSAVKLANRMIYEAAQSQSQLNGMGTTLTALLLNGNRLSIAHVGDSRAYLIREGVIEQITDDHTIVSEQVARGMMTREEAARSGIRNILSRALGIAPEVDVDMEELTVSEGDQFVLCSDGLSELILEEEILSEVRSSKRPDLACDELVNLANQRGGVDNITVIVAHLRGKNPFSYLLRILGLIRG